MNFRFSAGCRIIILRKSLVDIAFNYVAVDRGKANRFRCPRVASFLNLHKLVGIFAP